MSEETSSRPAHERRKLLAAGIYIIIILIGALLLLPWAWYLWVIILVIALFRIYSLLAPKPAFQCQSCGTVFRDRGRTRTLRPTAQDLYASDESAKCPKCGSKSLTKTKMRPWSMPRERPFGSVDTWGKPCARATTKKRKKVLFICTRNSARSQMAEAILRCLYGDVYEAFSAGTKPDRVHPLALDVLGEAGIDVTGLRSKGIEDLLDHFFDVVVTLCDQARETCPIYPGAAEALHHSFNDPSSTDGTLEERVEAFRAVRDEIGDWVEATFGPTSPRYLAPPSEFF